MIGLVAQILHHGQLPGLHLGGDLFQHPGRRDPIGQLGDHHLPLLPLVDRPQPQGAVAGLVDFGNLLPGGDDLPTTGKIRSRDMLAQFLHRGIGCLQQMDTGRHHLPGVMGGNIGGHPHGDPGGAVEQQIGQPGRQHQGLFQGAVEVGGPVNGPLAQFRQQHLGIGCQPGFGIAHGGKGLGIVRGAPVALAVHQRVTIGKRLGHQHHGLIAGRVSMGMVFAQHIPHGTGGLLVLGGGRQSQFRHGVDDTPLHRFKTVTDMGQGPVEDDVHGVVQIRLFGESAQGNALHPLGGGQGLIAHALSSGSVGRLERLG